MNVISLTFFIHACPVVELKDIIILFYNRLKSEQSFGFTSCVIGNQTSDETFTILIHPKLSRKQFKIHNTGLIKHLYPNPIIYQRRALYI